MSDKMNRWSVAIPGAKAMLLMLEFANTKKFAEENGFSDEEYMTLFEEYRKLIYRGQPPNAFVNSERVTSEDMDLQKAMKDYQTGFKKKFEK